MANDEQVALLKQGVAAWNAWRDAHPDIRPDLRGAHLSRADLKEADLRGALIAGADLTNADLRGANLSGAYLLATDLREALLGRVNLTNADLRRADLREANFSHAKLGGANFSEGDLREANLSYADLSGANFSGANLSGADLGGANRLREIWNDRQKLANLPVENLVGANLSNADLSGANLRGADLGGANLVGANLQAAVLVDTNLTDADLTSCRIYGVSAWRLKLEGAKQQNLVIAAADEPEITVDNIEVAQFLYLLLHNEKIRNVIDTITSKTVLILGRFTDERKAVLDALRDELRKRDYLPILFDFERPRSRDTDETITLLARMARFVIADISDAKAVLQELRAIVPDLPSVPVQPIILAIQEEPGMFDFYRNRPSFLPVHRYVSQEQLLADLGEKVIRPAELKVLDLRAST
jgi:uncharacterized protein YjbI with pentapeptide repeats